MSNNGTIPGELRSTINFLTLLYGDQSILLPDQRAFWFDEPRDALVERVTVDDTTVSLETVIRNSTDPRCYVARAFIARLDTLIPDATLRACFNEYLLEQNSVVTHVLYYGLENGMLMCRRDYEIKSDPEDQVGSYVITRGWVQQVISELPGLINDVLKKC